LPECLQTFGETVLFFSFFVLNVYNVGPGGRELDIGALFEKYTIDEIRDIEKKTRLSLFCCY